MENKKENIPQDNNTNANSSHIHTDNHTNCNCHQPYTNNVNNLNDDKKSKSKKLLGILVFIPIIIIKIFSSYVLYMKYYVYDLRNETDIAYSRFSITIFAIWLYITYFMGILTPPRQTNIDKYTSLNKEKCAQKEVMKLKQNIIMCPYCNHAKFNRSSHCRVCKSCMSFRDHHCIFINNCTGFSNIQYFVCFLFWGAYAIIFDMYAYLSFTYLQLSKTVRIISFIDFLGNAFFLCNIISILIRSLLAIYENRTFIEITKNPSIEDKCPFYDWHKEKNKKMAINQYNIGFLTHFYYLVGPSLLHFFLPLNKFKKYTLAENCPIFCKAKYPDSIQMLKYFLKKDENYYEDKVLKPSEPEVFLKLCHQYYDDYNII